MPKVALCIGGRLTSVAPSFDVYVGVDRACLFLLENGLPLHLAVGDFDSVSADQLAVIKQAAVACHQAPAEKNDTDTELALKLIFAQYPDAQVSIFGAFGGRIDHELSNIFLPSDPELAPYMEQFVLVDEDNHIQFFPAGRHQVGRVSGMTYISFMLADDGQLLIDDAKYPLTLSHFFKKKIYASNEFVGETISFSLDRGYAVVVQSRDGR